MPAKPNFRFSSRPRAPTGVNALLQDALMICSFGLWAIVLGLSPVLAYHLLQTA